MDVICTTGFGLDVSAQTEVDNPFVEHAKLIMEKRGVRNPMLLFGCKFLTYMYILPFMLLDFIH